MKKIIKKLYYKIFKRYEILERRCVSYTEADRLIKRSQNLPEINQWVLDIEKEDKNKTVGIVYLCRKKRK